mgnify:CR=1 FL=1
MVVVGEEDQSYLKSPYHQEMEEVVVVVVVEEDQSYLKNPYYQEMEEGVAEAVEEVGVGVVMNLLQEKE